MAKKDITQLRKRYTKDKHNFTRIAGAYVNNDKTILSSFVESPGLMEEEEFCKYLDVAKKSLSGKVGNNIMYLPFTSEEKDDPDISDLLLKLKDKGLDDKEDLDELYQRIIDLYIYAGNYLIIVFSDTYDVPSKAKDNSDLGESEDVFEYLLVSICPVNLSKPGLGFRTDEDRIGVLLSEWTAAPVESAFMYPSFSDGCGDLDHVTVYSKKPAEPHNELWTEVLNVVPQMSETEKLDAFVDMVEPETDDDSHDEQMFDVADGIEHLIEEKQEMQDDDMPVDISADEIEDVLSDAGFNEDAVKKIRKKYDEVFSSASDKPSAEDLLDAKQLKNQKLYHEKKALAHEVMRLSRKEAASGGISLSVPAETKDSILFSDVDGRKCIVIPVDDEDIMINGEKL